MNFRHFIFIALFCLLLVASVDSGITPFNLNLPPDTYISERIGVFLPTGVPFPQYVKSNPYGQWQFSFTVISGVLSKVSTHFIVGTSEQIKRIGIEYEHVNFFCCTEYLVNQSMCNQSNVNQIAFPKDMNPYENNGTFYYYPIEFSQTSATEASGALGPFRINFTTESIWYMMVVNCNDESLSNSTTVRLMGTSVWMNPYGYLPGQLYGQMPVYWSLTILYFFFFLSWGISCLVYRNSLHPVQYTMLVVLAVSFLENIIWGAAFVRYNVTGENDNIWNGFGTFFLALKLTLSRTMLLLICMGYSITHVDIPRQQQYGVLGLALCYFIISACNHFFQVLQDHGDQISYASTMLLVFLDFVASGTMFIWIFASLHFTRSDLKARKEVTKLRMYTGLAISVGIIFGLSVIIFITQFLIEMFQAEDKIWKGEFFFTLYWEFAFFFILMVVGFIWRPHYDNYRYAYIEHKPEEHHGSDSEEMADMPPQLPPEEEEVK